MSCNFPLKLFWTDSYTNSAGETVYRSKVCSFRTDHLERIHGDWIPIEFPVVSSDCTQLSSSWISIPCGQCMECRLQKAREWANRIMCEAKYYDSDECWFVTLTYDDENVPLHSYNKADGTVGFSLSLEKSDLQKFFKRLRYYKGKVRMYSSGEYGEITFRPHYHSIIFGLKLDPVKLSLWKSTDLGFSLFESSELEEIWNMGRVIVGQLSWDSACYVSRYVTKKLTGKALDSYKVFNLQPEFSLMSRNPGIGRQYAFDHPDDVLNGRMYLSTLQDGLQFSTPRYFKNLLSVDNSIERLYNGLRSSDKLVDHMNLVKSVNGLARRDWLSYLESQDRILKQNVKSLNRGDV